MRRFRRAAVFPKVHAASPRGFMDCAQLRQPTGSVRDRLTPPGPVQRGVTLYRCVGGGDALTGDKCCLRKWSGRHGRPYKLIAAHGGYPQPSAAKPLSNLRTLRPNGPAPFGAYGTTFLHGKHVTGFSVAFGSLRIQFLCHPASGGTINRGGPF